MQIHRTTGTSGERVEPPLDGARIECVLRHGRELDPGDTLCVVIGRTNTVEFEYWVRSTPGSPRSIAVRDEITRDSPVLASMLGHLRAVGRPTPSM